MIGVLRPVTVVTIATAFTFGVNLALLGCLKLWLSRALNLGEGRVRTLLVLHNVALLLCTVVAGGLVDAVGVQPVLVLASAALAVALFALSCQPNPTGAFAGVLLAAAGNAGLGISGLVLMTAAFFPRNPVASLNAGLLFVALGSLLAPAVTDVLMRLMGYRRAVALVALVCLIPGMAAAISTRNDLAVVVSPAAVAVDSAGDDDAEEVPIVPANNLIWLACLVTALYSPVEAAVSSWAATHLSNPGPQEPRAGRYTTGFWVAFLLSRLLVAGLMYATRMELVLQASLLVIPALLTAVILGNMAGAVSPGKAGKGLLLAGLCLGPVLPTLLGMLFGQLENSDGRGFGIAFGLLFAAGSLGSLLLAPLVRSATRRGAPQSALRGPLVVALLLSAAALVFGLAARQGDAGPAHRGSASAEAETRSGR